MERLISYGFTKEYLKDWGIQEALREIYQNFMDFGKYNETVVNHDSALCTVTIINNYKPDAFEFLGLGTSRKDNPNAIGKHGEGLKVAMFVLSRLNCPIDVRVRNNKLTGGFEDIDDVGSVFAIFKDKLNTVHDFTVRFMIHKEDYKLFKSNLITKDDIIYHESGQGSIVNKPTGNIYSGGLFVAKVKNFQYAYDILPQNLSLDRDRRIPGAFDVSYHSSKIKQGYIKFVNKMEGLDTEYRDSEYISEVPKSFIKDIKPKMVGDEPVFVHTDSKGTETIIKNNHIISAIKKDNIIHRWLRWVKHLAMRKLGLYDMLISFGEKYVHDEDAKREFDIILNKVKP